MTKLQSIIERYLLLWLLLSSGAAFVSSGTIVGDALVGSKPWLPGLITVTMFAIGWLLPAAEVKQVWTRWPTVLGGTLVQYIAMPGLAYLLVRGVGFSSSLAIGITMVGCVPGAMASNILTVMARGNTSYSVSLTTMATILSPLMVPLSLWLTLGESVSSSVFVNSARSLTTTVVLPVLFGHVLSRCLTSLQQPARVLGSIVANLSILWIVAFVVAANQQTLRQIQPRLVLTLLCLNLLGYCAGYLGGGLMKLPGGMQRALTLEVGMQNAGLGTVLVTTLFPDDLLVTVPTALYTFGCMLTGTVLAYAWQVAGAKAESLQA